MRKQNRNNRICTNEESGKTDFIIDPLLPIGKENAITTQELMRISGCGSSRELRQRILGHSSLAMTMDLYSHVLPDTKADEMQKIANVF